jgi:undecaprenyl-diphosphatase
MGLDRWVLSGLAAHRTEGADALAQGLMTVGVSPLTYVAALLLCLLFGWLFRAWLVAIAALVSAMLAVGLADVGKDLIGRPRPPASLAHVDTGGYAMPSSIAAMTLGAAMPVILFGFRSATRAGRLVAAVLVAATVLTGISMIYLGAHWLTDVLVGWVLGAAVGAATLLVVTKVGRVGARAVRERSAGRR